MGPVVFVPASVLAAMWCSVLGGVPTLVLGERGT
jgi:hypothetical protein